MRRGEHEATKALIQEAYAILAEEQPTTVRRVVYALFTKKKITSTDKDAENQVSRLLTIARKDGRIPWEWIVDEHRRPERVLTFRNPAEAFALIKQHYRKDYWPAQPVLVRVWSEKSTVAGILAPVLREYEVEFLPVHGNNSTTRIREASDAQIRDGRPWVILYVGDWDPSGCYMSDVDAARRVREYGANIEIKRVALLQQDVMTAPQLAFDVDDKRRAAMQKYGDKVGKCGIDNNRAWFLERYGRACMELDAMNSQVLRDRVQTAVEEYIDWPSWEHMKLIEQAELTSTEEIFRRMNGQPVPIVRHTQK
jgi:hypothetical protein